VTSTRKVELETVYRMSWKNILLLFFIGLLLGIFMAHEAQTNTKQLLINGLIELSVEQAVVFFWAIAAIMLGMVLLSFAAVFQRLRGSNRLTITGEGLLMPGPVWSPRERFYPFSSIESLKLVSVYKSKILQVKAKKARFAIASQNVASPEEFETIVALLQQRVSRHAS
jgi:hypothetical protein